MSDSEGRIELKSLIKRLAPDQFALFEPISAIMLLNVEEEEYEAGIQRWLAHEATPEDGRMLAAINHETYHFAQAAASGYMFERQRSAFRVLLDAPPPPKPAIDANFLKLMLQAREMARDDAEKVAEIDRGLEMVAQQNYLAELDARAAPGDHSLMGALIPEFFAYLDRRREGEKVANPSGLSITGLIEGSAVIHTHALMHPGGPALDHVRDEIATLPPVYGELFALTAAHGPERTIELALPTTAVALCYTRPHDAYCALLPMIAASPAGEALARGRALFDSPPEIEQAGPWLGDALVQRAADDSYQIYDPMQEPLRSNQWGVGAYDFLADPQAMHRIGRFPMGLATRSGCRGAFNDQDDAYARLAISAAVLKVASRRRAERDFQSSLAAWIAES